MPLWGCDALDMKKTCVYAAVTVIVMTLVICLVFMLGDSMEPSIQIGFTTLTFIIITVVLSIIEHVFGDKIFPNSELGIDANVTYDALPEGPSDGCVANR